MTAEVCGCDESVALKADLASEREWGEAKTDMINQLRELAGELAKVLKDHKQMTCDAWLATDDDLLARAAALSVKGAKSEVCLHNCFVGFHCAGCKGIAVHQRFPDPLLPIYRAGEAAMRERAERVADDYSGERIRALTLSDEVPQ